MNYFKSSKSKMMWTIHSLRMIIPLLMMLFSFVAFSYASVNANAVAQQTQTITGTVTEAGGSPIPGVNVVVKGTSIGIITDLSGKYTIQNVPANAILIFSFVGMKSQEIPVAGRVRIDVELEEETSEIEEVVVVGYGTVSRKNLTTAISKVSGDDVTKAATSNMSQMLLGRAAGLQATVASAQPGGNVDISIRGASTTTPPVYVVDGIVMPAGSLEPGLGGMVTPSSVNRSGLAGLNPEDIESIEILKDASASIYGIGAANGVILVTTKKGKEGPLSVNYEGSYSTVVNYPYPTPLNAQEYMEYVNIFDKERYMYNSGISPYGTNADDGKWNPVFSTEDIANAKTTNWMNEIMRTGSINNHSLTISGGSRAVSYYISGNYFNQVGSVANSSMERFALRSNIGLALTPFLKLSATINFNQNNYLNSTVGGTGGGRGPEALGALAAALTYPPYLPIRDENGKYTTHKTVPNAVGMLEIDDNTENQGNYLNFTADIDIIPNILSAKLQYGNNMENSRRSMYVPSYIYFDQKYQSRGNLGDSRRMNQTLEATMRFRKYFFNAVDFDFLVGMGRYDSQYTSMNVAYTNQYDAIANDNLSSVFGTITPASNRREDQKRSQFTIVNFDILDRYVISGTLRRDGTDKFFPGKKYAYFPAISFAWKVSNESFLKEIEWINLLKLRGSYGVTGSDNLGTTLYGTFGPSSRHVIFNEGATRYVPIIMNGIDYPDVTWEKTIMQNIGIDFYMLKDRVSGSFDLFRNDITDRLGTANTAGLSMFASYPINGSKQRREGWDATLNTRNIVQKNFSWSTIMTFLHYKSLWIERMPNYDYNNYEIRGKVSTNMRYYYKTKGIINADKSNMPASQPEAGQHPGYPIIVDKDGDGVITKEDIYTTDNTPKIYIGFGNTFRYNNFDLDIFMYSQLGMEKYNYALDWASPSELSNQNSNSNIYAKRIWNSQTNPNGTLPGISQSLASVTLPEGVGTNLRYQNASFLRVRNITLGYNLKGSQLGVAGNAIGNLRIYADVQNPITITNFDGFDPEVTTGGSYKGGKAEYPQTRTYSIGVKISFNTKL